LLVLSLHEFIFQGLFSQVIFMENRSISSK